MQQVAGYCPKGCGETLFLGAGGHVTCSLRECPEPDAASVLLHRVVIPRRSPTERSTAFDPPPNPTEEQTSGERALWNDRFEIWWTPVLEAARTAEEDDPAVGETAAIGRIKGIAHAAWDARQPEIDRLRAALERIAESKGNGLDQRIAREALDG